MIGAAGWAMLLLVQAQGGPPLAPSGDVVVTAPAGARLGLTYRVRNGRIVACGAARSSGDRRVDRVMCAAFAECVAARFRGFENIRGCIYRRMDRYRTLPRAEQAMAGTLRRLAAAEAAPAPPPPVEGIAVLPRDRLRPVRPPCPRAPADPTASIEETCAAPTP